jgi:ABC-2 type transport system ATP-binding protein
MSFALSPGNITGFVGPNGAGKSTTLRVILGLDRADGGEALVCGRRYPDLRRPLRHLGALLDAGALHPARSVRNHLLWMARSQGLGAGRVDEVLDLVGLGSVARWRCRRLSLGMRQRLGIAAALLGDPPVLMLDEPFNGMDPEGTVWLREILRGLAGQGRAVLISSHLMHELEGIADHLLVVGRGRVIADTTVAALVASGTRVTLRSADTAKATVALESAGATVSAPAAGTVTVSGLAPGAVEAVLRRRGVESSELSAHVATLEEAYLELTRDEVVFRGGVPR